MSALRVAILGAESSGKSTLAAALAAHCQTLWVPEYLREFVDLHQRTPHEAEQVLIARTQIAREEHAAGQTAGWLFCDTTPLMTALYSDFYFGRIDPVLAALATRRYAITLVAAPESPWVADGLQRESAAVRQLLHDKLIAKLQATGCAYLLLQGTLSNRIDQWSTMLSSASRDPGGRC